MKSIRLFLAILVGKLIGFLTQALGYGSGQAAPGLVALKIYPDLVKDLSAQIEKKSIITATNGKTTTSGMIAQILEENCERYIRNKSGSNLARGIASTLIESSDYLGNIDAKFGIFELDEAEFSNVADKIKPDVIVLGNIFRDQLDRYGEIDTIAKKWQKTLEKLSTKTILIVNADDPTLSLVSNSFRGDKIFYGIKTHKKLKKDEIEYAADSVRCFNCKKILNYKTRTFSHLGDYYCIGCSLSRPKLDVWGGSIVHKKDCLEFKLYDNKSINNIKINIVGSYNVYNAVSAFSVGKTLGFDTQSIISAFDKFQPAFGRMEEFEYGKNKFKMILVKNPTGANTAVEILRKIHNKYLICALNDNIADGTDVSWIYDVDFESVGDVKKIICMGKRKYDLALRLKYAGISEKQLAIRDDYWQEITRASKVRTEDYIYILPTYTAMLEVRKILEKKGLVDKI